MKPSILIYNNSDFNNNDIILEICCGIEEEEAIYENYNLTGKNYRELGFEACKNSVVEVGIGICNKDAAFYLKGFDIDKPIFEYNNITLREARTLGHNAARAVKKKTFLYEGRVL